MALWRVPGGSKNPSPLRSGTGASSGPMWKLIDPAAHISNLA
jgi:hypothetical protein